MFDKLPTEIQDRIFLQFSPHDSDWKTLQNTRELQSSYVRRRTAYNRAELAAQHNNIDNMKWLYYHNKYPDNFILIRCVIPYNNFEMFKWLVDKGVRIDNQDFDIAAYYGKLDIMKYLYKKGIRWGYKALTNAVIFGELENIKWLLEMGHPYDEKTLIAPINASGEFFIKKTHRLKSPIIEAVKSDNFENVKYLYEHGCTWSKDVFKYAALNGNLDIIKYFYHLYRRNDFLNNSIIFANAAKFAACQDEQKGLENMQWLLDNDFTFDKFVFIAVADSINVMDWLYAKRFKNPKFRNIYTRLRNGAQKKP
jgi:ankyrin repeat protein